MARQPRSNLHNVDWHVIARGNRRQNIFEEEADWSRFRSSLLEELSTESAIVIALCLMTNHFHLLTPSDIEIVSRVLHRVLTSHATYMNKKYGRTGHLFEDRFKSYPCDPEFGRKPLVRYIHNNPVRAGLVRTPEEWAWSTHREYLTPESTMPTGREVFLQSFGADDETAILSYQAYMAPSPKPKPPPQGGKVPLGVLAAYLEREGGHRPGLLKERSQRRDLLGTRRRFIEMAVAEGHTIAQIAAFLCVSTAAVYHCRQTH